MKNFNFLTLLILGFLVAGCSTSPISRPPSSSTSSRIPDGDAGRIKALLSAGKDFGTIISVPAAGNAISNAMMVTALKAGSGSSSVNDLVKFLKAPGSRGVAVVGTHDAVTSATIEAAVRELNGAGSAAKIYFAGEEKYGKSLAAMGATAGVKIEAVVFP